MRPIEQENDRGATPPTASPPRPAASVHVPAHPAARATTTGDARQVPRNLAADAGQQLELVPGNLVASADQQPAAAAAEERR